MDKTKIVLYAFPFHIDMLERCVAQLKRAANYSDTKSWLALDIVLNLSEKDFDWSTATLPRQYFIDKFNYLEKYCDFCLSVNFDQNDEIQGSGEHQRRILEQNDGEYNLIWLDPDVYFPPQILAVIERAHQAVQASESSDTYLLTPQCAKFWDDSWNIISNENYIQSPVKFDDINVFELDNYLETHEVSLTRNYNHKFAGGWFNFHSSALTKLMKLPPSIGIFHHIDMFQQERFNILNGSPHYDIPQYILQNCIIQEDRKYYHYNESYLRSRIPYTPRTLQDSELIKKEVFMELNKISNETSKNS